MLQTSIGTIDGMVDPTWRIGLVLGRYYPEQMGVLEEGALSMLHELGIPHQNVHRAQAVGSFEIPLIATRLVAERKVDAVIALSIIVEGETHHARLVAEQAARGCMDIQLTHGIPCAFEVLYVDTIGQVTARSQPHNNKGAQAAYTVIQSLIDLQTLASKKD